MTAREPLVVKNGQTEQLQSGDVLNASAVISTDQANALTQGTDGGTYLPQNPYAHLNFSSTVITFASS
jgi:hypothetical protein